MRYIALVFLVGAALATTVAPTQSQTPTNAEWKSYVSREFGFAFQAPGEVKAEYGTTMIGGTGEHQTVVFRSLANNIEYKVTAVDYEAQVGDGANILLEAAFKFQEGKNVLMDIYASIDNSEESSMEATAAGRVFVPQRPDRQRHIYGRKITINLPNNGGRSTAAFYFHNGNLIQAQATVLPANGDYGTFNMPRFIESVAFLRRHIAPDAIDLRLP